MAKQLDARMTEILQKYHPEPRKAVWDCHGTLVIYHKAVEQVAAAAGIEFYPPEVIVRDQINKSVAIIVTGKMGDKTEWSIGEAAPYNNKNSYPFAMAEKRAKDRVVLKLLGLHGEIYSEDEADDFKSSPANDQIDAASEDDSANLRDEIIAAFRQAMNGEELQKIGAQMARHIPGLIDKHQKEARKAFSDIKRKLTEAA